MRSREQFLKNFLSAAIVLVLLPACGIKIGETPIQTPPLSLSSAEMGCLAPAPKVFDRYVKGDAKSEEVEQIFDCAEQAINTFMTKTRGAKEGAYTRQELESFLERYFLNHQRWSSETYQSLFEFKSALIGGSLDSVTSRELEVAQDLVRLLKIQTLRLKPLMPLSRLRESKVEFGDLNEAAGIFSDIGLKIGQFLERTSEGYSFAQLDRAFVQLAKLLPQMSFESYRDSIEMMRAWKETFISSSNDRITRKDWPRIFSESAKWYFLFAKYERFTHQPSSYLCGEGRELTVGLIRESIGVVERSLALKGVSEIRFSDLDKIIDTIPFPEGGLQKATVKDALRKITVNVLRNVRTRDLVAARMDDYRSSLMRTLEPSLRVSDLKQLGILISEWNLGQALIESLFAKNGRACDRTLRWDRQFGDLTVSAQEIDKGFDAFVSARDLGKKQAQTAREIGAFMHYSTPLWEPGRAKVLLGRDRRGAYSYLELSTRNTLKVFLEAIYEGYGAERQRDGRVNRLTKNELNQFYLDIRDAGIEIKLVDPRLWDWADNRFREANMFTLIGNGDEFTSLQELSDLILELISVRLLSSDLLHESSRQCQVFGKDIFGYDIIEEKCFFEFLKVRLGSDSMNAPKWVAFYRSLSDDRKDVIVSMMRGMVLPQGWKGVESALTDVWAGIFHFEELIFERYDLDRSGGLDVREAEAAFPQFRPLLRQVSGLENDADLFAVLTYVLAKGAVPTNDVSGISSFVWWKLNRSLWNFHADRSYVVKVFSAISKPPF